VRDEDIDVAWPQVPEWASQAELEPDVRRDLRGLSKEGAEFVGGHLVAAGTLADDDPELAWLHARAARSKGGRIAVVRETVGLVGYRAGHWAEAISELRAARRMGGGPGHLAVLADCERAMGHPDKAIEISRPAEAEALDPAATAELTIVTAGARADLGQLDAALVTLEAAGATDPAVEPWTARLQYAYADLLAKADRRREALTWFMRAHDADGEDETDAAERIAELADGEDDLPIDLVDTAPHVETAPSSVIDLEAGAESVPTEPDSPREDAVPAEPDVPAADSAPEPGSVSAQLFSHADAPGQPEPEDG
jgi:tetratricopeptide (TPR) repeat protein